MKVHILNYKDGQLIQHSSVLYLKGFISFENESLDLFNLSKDLEIIQNAEISCSFKSFNVNFISLAQLSEGENTFCFNNKTTEETIFQFQLNYSPASGNYSVVPLYICSRDSIKSEDVGIKLKLGMKVIQGFFGEKLFEHGFSKRSFQIEENLPYVLSVDLKSEEILEMESDPLWTYLALVIRDQSDLWSRQYKYVVFMADPWKCGGNGEGHSQLALGGGGLVLMGSDFLKVWPEDVGQVLDKIFNLDPLQDPALLLSASRFGDVGRTEGSLYAASLGSLAHEMGHIFDLGHSELGMMGRQFHRMETSFSPVLSYPPILQGSGGLLSKVGLPGGESGEDVVSIGHSCATILYFHRWFSPGLAAEDVNRDDGPKFIKEKIFSKIPLTAIQIRELDNGKILKDWTFPENKEISPIHEFILAKNHIPLSCTNGDALVIAQDSQGNILKKTINRDLVPQSFTVIQRR